MIRCATPASRTSPFNGEAEKSIGHKDTVGAVVKVICRPQSQPGEPRRDQETELSLGLGGAQPEG